MKTSNESQKKEHYSFLLFSELSTAEKKVLNFLNRGGQYSVVEMVENLKISDPRSAIRYLRNKGVPIADYWVKTDFSRHKKYFLK